jgi:FHS family Na+ dependent glucose MFS transporter 1
MMVVGQFLIPLFPTFYFILFAMFIIGLGLAVIDIGGNVIILWIYQSKVGPYINALYFCFGIGALFLPYLFIMS